MNDGNGFVLCENDIDILCNYSHVMNDTELAKMIGCSSGYVSKLKKKLGINTNKTKKQKSISEMFNECINKKKIRNLETVIRTNPNKNGIDSEIDEVIYQNSPLFVTMVSHKYGLFTIPKSQLKKIADELNDIYEVYVG